MATMAAIGGVARNFGHVDRSPASQVVAFSNSSSKMSPIRCAQSTMARASSKQSSEDGYGRVFNFAAGPANLPANVIKAVQAELLNFKGLGMSIMEMSHRSKAFMEVIQKAESDLRTLLGIPDTYDVLFLQGGATTQFSAVPYNLCGQGDDVDFIVSGSWGNKALQEAQKFCNAKLAWSGKASKYTTLPTSQDEIKLTPGAKYVHICANETIHGVEFREEDYPQIPDDSILVADMSSNFCSKPVDVTRFGLIYAGAQKNVGPAGVTIVIVRKDLIGNAREGTPVMFDYKPHSDNKSMYNTPPCLPILICGLVFDDLIKQGGLEAISKKNAEKAGILYDAIDSSHGFFKCPVEKGVRSYMNVPFTMASKEMEAEFISEAASNGMVELKGHRSVGGVRASIYNAMPKAGVEKLVALMKDFQARY